MLAKLRLAGLVAALGMVFSLLSAGGAVAAAAATGSLTGAPIHPLRSPNGSVQRTLRHQVETSNWSGYAEANFKTGLSYTAASGTWVVPTVKAVSGFSTAYSSSWVGIGGFCTTARCNKVDRTLIQLGTEQDVASSGTTTYYAWYEMLPSAPVKIPLTVVRGDQVTASLSKSPSAGTSHGPGQHGGGHHVSSQIWLLSMDDLTTGKSWSTTVTYSSSLLSAEWIEEAPSSGTVLPLANFGTMNFDAGTVNSGSSPNLQGSQGVIMLDPYGQSANPSGPDPDSDGFNACWSATHTLASCTAPATS